jgi:hypothetical protein
MLIPWHHDFPHREHNRALQNARGKSAGHMRHSREGENLVGDKRKQNSGPLIMQIPSSPNFSDDLRMTCLVIFFEKTAVVEPQNTKHALSYV